MMWRMPSRPLALLTLLFAVLLLQGCVASRAQVRRVDAVVAATTDRRVGCDRDDHCAAASLLLDAANEAMTASTPQQPVHVISLLNDSEAAMVARLNLIRAAHRSID